MMNISIETLISLLEKSAKDNDKVKVLALIGELKTLVKTDAVAVKWLADPTNLKYTQDLLIEHLGVGQKLLMVKGRIPHRQRRVLMFVQAMENGVKRVLND